MEKPFSGFEKLFNKPKNDFPWGINKRGNVLTIAKVLELAKLEVEVNEEKSRSVDLAQGESFGFLGFEFRRILSRRGLRLMEGGRAAVEANFFGSRIAGDVHDEERNASI
jgi:hypothetical protein